MDAAQKLLKNSALLTATALLLATVGLAQPTLNVPTVVSLAGTGGQDVDVSSSSPATPITYTIGPPVYVADGAGVPWLRVTGGTTTPATLSFNLFIAPQTGGSHQATVLLHPTSPAGVADVTITVTYTSGTGNGGGSSTLSASPAGAVTLTAAANGQATAGVTITTTTASAINLSLTTAVGAGTVNWLNSSSLAASSISSSGGTTLTITANAFGLTSGVTYQGTVTITPSNGTPLTINVNLTVGASITNGSWTASPGTIGWSYTTNSGNFPTQAISVSTTTTSPTYSISTFSTNGWLLATVNGVDGTSFDAVPIANTFTVKVGSQANSLAAGPTTGQVVIKDSTGAGQLTITVTLTVTSGAGTTLTVTPNPVLFNIGLNGAQQSQTVFVTSSTTGALSVTGSLPTGLLFQLSTNTVQAGVQTNAFIVLANPAGLAAGTYPGTLTVSVAGSQSTTVNVSMIVGSGGTGTTAVAPVALTFSYELGTDPINFAARQKLAITGPAGAWTSTITTANGINWLKLTPANGSALPNPASDSDTPIVSIDATGLGTGTYGGFINISTTGGTQAIAVTLNVVPGTVLLPTPGSLVFAAQTGQRNPAARSIFFSGSDGALNPLSISALSNNGFITVTNDATSITVQVDQTGLTTGVYSGSVSVTQAGAANSPTTIPVVLVVNGGGSGGGNPGGTTGNVTVSPTSLSFTAPSGSSPATQSITVNSASGVAGIGFTVQATTTDSATWLSTNAGANNTTQSTLTVSVNSNALQPGAYTGNLRILPNGGNVVNVPVNLTITALSTISATPTTLTFDFRAGAAAPAPKQLTVSAGAALTYSVTPSSTGNWLLASPATGTTPGTVNVSVNPTGLSAGTYNGTVLVAGTGGAPGATSVAVILNVTVPLPTITGVSSAARSAPGAISPGEIISIFSSDSSIGPDTSVFLTLDSTGKVATNIGGVQVLINGFLCPITFASGKQVNAVVPYEVKVFTSATILVKFLGQSSNGIPVNVVTTLPGLFTANASGTGPGAILNSDGITANSPSNLAARGDTVAVYLTGEGETSPAGTTGKVTTVAAPPQPLTPRPLLPISVTVGGQPANFTFAGEAPGLITGVLQLNVVLPTNIAAGDQPIVVTIGGNPSQQGVTVSVK